MTPLFKRNDETTIAELEDYYANQKKSRTGTAWLMALLSLLITVAVIVALFFGGRWLYRTLTSDSSDSTPVATQDSDANDVRLPDIDGEVPAGNGSGTTDDNEDEEVDENGAAGDGVVSDEAVSTTRDVAGTAEDNDQTTELPDTGAGESLALLLATLSVVGYGISRKRQVAKQ